MTPAQQNAAVRAAALAEALPHPVWDGPGMYQEASPAFHFPATPKPATSPAEALARALETLDECRGNINPERGFAEELEADIEKAMAAIRAAQGIPE